MLCHIAPANQKDGSSSGSTSGAGATKAVADGINALAAGGTAIITYTGQTTINGGKLVLNDVTNPTGLTGVGFFSPIQKTSRVQVGWNSI